MLWHEGRMYAIVAVRARSANLERSDIDALLDAQAASTLRTVEAFVAGEAYDVEIVVGHVNGHDSSGLRRIHDDERSVCVSYLRHTGDIVNVACQVGGMRDCGDSGVRRKCGLESLVIQRPVGGDWHDRYLGQTGILCAEQRAENGIVRCRCRHGMIAWLEKPANRDVERFSRVVSECHLFRVGIPEQVGDLLSCREHGHSRIERGFMHASAHTAERVNRMCDGHRHLRWLHAGGRCVIEVDHGFPSKMG